MFHHVAVEARLLPHRRLRQALSRDAQRSLAARRRAPHGALDGEAAQSLRGGARPEEGPGWREGLRWVEGWFGPGPGKVPGFGKFVSFFDLKNL